MYGNIHVHVEMPPPPLQRLNTISEMDFDMVFGIHLTVTQAEVTKWLMHDKISNSTNYEVDDFILVHQFFMKPEQCSLLRSRQNSKVSIYQSVRFDT